MFISYIYALNVNTILKIRHLFEKHYFQVQYLFDFSKRKQTMGDVTDASGLKNLLPSRDWLNQGSDNISVIQYHFRIMKKNFLIKMDDKVLCKNLLTYTKAPFNILCTL